MKVIFKVVDNSKTNGSVASNMIRSKKTETRNKHIIKVKKFRKKNLKTNHDIFRPLNYSTVQFKHIKDFKSHNYLSDGKYRQRPYINNKQLDQLENEVLKQNVISVEASRMQQSSSSSSPYSLTLRRTSYRFASQIACNLLLLLASYLNIIF